MPKLLSVQEAAEQLNVQAVAVNRIIARRLLKATPIDRGAKSLAGSFRIVDSDLAAYVQKGAPGIKMRDHDVWFRGDDERRAGEALLTTLRSLAESQQLTGEAISRKRDSETMQLQYTATMKAEVDSLTHLTIDGHRLTYGEAFLIETIRARGRNIVETVAAGRLGATLIETLYATPEDYDRLVSQTIVKAGLNGISLRNSALNERGEPIVISYMLRASRMFSDRDFQHAARLAF